MRKVKTANYTIHGPSSQGKTELIVHTGGTDESMIFTQPISPIRSRRDNIIVSGYWPIVNAALPPRVIGITSSRLVNSHGRIGHMMRQKVFIAHNILRG